jgi:imidazolonepropionase-like amidohydrolase
LGVLPALALQLLAITHVTVIDMTGGPPRRDVTVVVDKNRIASVGAAAATVVPSGARQIDGRGRFLIPGLWDMHVHTVLPGVSSARALVPLYVANGVTGVRDMGGTWDSIQAYRRDIEAGRLIGPRIVAAGPYLDFNDPPVAHFRVRSRDDARHAVDSLAALGVDLVKIHSRLPREAVFETLRAARARKLPVGGHVSSGVTIEEVSDSGQRSLEHLLGFANTCTQAESLSFASVHPLFKSLFGECTSRDLGGVYRRLAANGTWVTPTLAPQWEFAILPETTLAADSLRHYVPSALRAFWDTALGLPKGLPKETSAIGRALLAKRLRLVRELDAVGVPLLAGTDAPLRNSIPGFGLHEELESFVKAGITPLRALRAATYEPARYLQALDSLGTIEPGKVADLVLLSADPLSDIRHTRRIEAVVVRGRVIDAAARQSLFAAAERAAARSR